MKNSIFVIHKWRVNCPREKGVSFSGKTTHDFHHTETQFRKNYARLLRSICEQMKSTLRDVKYCSKLNNATGTSWINATSTPSASSLLAECISLHCKTKLFRSLSPSQVKWKCFFILFVSFVCFRFKLLFCSCLANGKFMFFILWPFMALLHICKARYCVCSVGVGCRSVDDESFFGSKEPFLVTRKCEWNDDEIFHIFVRMLFQKLGRRISQMKIHEFFDRRWRRRRVLEFVQAIVSVIVCAAW